ncbi:MAG: glycosyltransferase family 4 protein [Proteobacteria bacterium]|nr:glycosyltransferase family 4 protein [Pseudomonadota bacterium]
MRVLLLPAWAENPYQALLARHLRTRGAAVRDAPWQELLHPVRIWRAGTDVVHLHAPGRPTRTRSSARALHRAARAALGLAFLRAVGVRLVWTAHDLQDHDQRHPVLDRWLTRITARLAGGVIVHGEHARSLVAQRFSIRGARASPGRLAVIPHGSFDLYAREGAAEDARRLRESLGIGADDFLFLFFGAIRDYKAPLELARAFAESGLRERGAHLLFRGPHRDPALVKELERMARDVSHLHVDPGFVPEEEVAGTMAASDAVVTPYRAVLTSGSAVLAMSLGRACVAPRLGGLPDLIDENCGFLYEADARDGLRDALRAAFAAREALPEMGRIARERATRVSWDHIAERTLQVYARGASSSGSQV